MVATDILLSNDTILSSSPDGSFPDDASLLETPNGHLDKLSQTLSNQQNISFDQRLSAKSNSYLPRPSKGRIELQNSTPLNLDTYLEPKMNWAKLRKISDVIYDNSTMLTKGDPVVIKSSDTRILIGTSKGYLYVFNLEQKLLHLLKTTNAKPGVSITSIALSFDSNYVAAGYSNGLINLWNLTKIDPIVKISPVTLHELQHNGSHYHIGHVENTAVRQIVFENKRHTALFTSDHAGMMFYHSCGRSLIGKFYCQSKIISGEYRLSTNPKLSVTNPILDMDQLPLGNVIHDTDTMGLIAVICPKQLLILSTKQGHRTEQIIAKPVMNDPNYTLTGSVAWFPIKKTETSTLPPVLAYCWSNVLSLLDVVATGTKNEYGDYKIKPRFLNKRSWECSETISSIKWFNTNVLLVMTKTQVVYFLSRDTLKVLKKMDILQRGLKSINVYENNNLGLERRSFKEVFTCFKSHVFLLERDTVTVASLANWADMLMEEMNNEKYLKALIMAKNQYSGTMPLSLIGLPENDESRHRLVKCYVIQIFKAFVNSMFDENIKKLENNEQIHLYCLFLHYTIQTCVDISADFELFDTVYEIFTEHGYENLFFQELEDFIFQSQIYVVSPSILKAMVEYYVSNQHSSKLEQLICLLDTTQLDIDLGIRICKLNHLNDCLCHIYTTVLNDYISPIIEALKQIKVYNEDLNLTPRERNEIHRNVSYVYPFVSYSLTGRLYPTGKPIDFSRSESAKLNICFFLFTGSTISWPSGTPKFHTVTNYENEPAFPYLHALLKFDSESMVRCLNEAFEDPILNDDEISTIKADTKYDLKVTRQYIIDILLSMSHNDEFELKFLDKVHIAIFVSRNYPKYQQFIRLADSIIHELFSLLCKVGSIYQSRSSNFDQESFITFNLVQDCELCLLSLLSIFKPLDAQPVIIQLEDAHYYNTLLTIYKSENMYYEIINLWIKLQKETEQKIIIDEYKPLNENNYKVDVGSIFGTVSAMVHAAFKNTALAKHHMLIELIHRNYELFVKSGPKEMAKVIFYDCPELTKDIINLNNNRIKFTFLKEIFELNSEGKIFNGSIMTNRILKIEYVKNLIDEFKDTQKAGKDIEFSITELRKLILNAGNLEDEIMQLLLQSGFEVRSIIVDFYVQNKKYEKALALLKESIIHKSEQIKNNGYNDSIADDVLKLYGRCFALTEKTDEILDEKVAESDLTLREYILLLNIEFAILLFNDKKEDNQLSDDYELKLYKTMIQRAFTYISTLSGSNSQAFSKIFETYLVRSSVKVTTLGNVRSVLEEVFYSYMNDEIIIGLILKLVKGDIFDNLEIIKNMKKKGWSPSTTDCEICGKKIWGSKISEEVYDSWKNYQLETVGLKEHEQTMENKQIQIYTFQCKHAYHTKCLEGMGMVNREKSCIFCKP